MLTDEQVRNALDEVLPSILEGLKKDVTASTIDAARRRVSSLVEAEISKWAEEKVIPAIQQALIESEVGIPAIAQSMAAEVCEALPLAAGAKIKANLENSWKRGQIFKALFE